MKLCNYIRVAVQIFAFADIVLILIIRRISPLDKTSLFSKRDVKNKELVFA